MNNDKAGRAWMRTILGVLGVLIVLGVLAELLLRIVPAASPEQWALERLKQQTPDGSPAMKRIKEQEEFAILQVGPDPVVGAIMLPNQHVLNKSLDYTYTLQTDHHGFVNRDPWPERMDVAVLGNSLIVGAGVGLEGVFTTLLERKFPGRSFINLGVPGGGTGMYQRLYERFAQPRSPKLVVATLWPVWEVDNTMKFAHWVRDKSSENFTEYRFNYGKEHPAPASTSAQPKARDRGGIAGALWSSALVRACYLTAKALTTHSPYLQTVSFKSGETLNLSMREQIRLAKGFKRPEEPHMEQVFTEPLEQMRNEVQAEGGRLLVVLVPSREEIYGTDSAPQVLKMIDAVKPLLESRKLTVLDLYPLFRERGKDRSPFFEREMHLNAYGNQVLADGIGAWIQANGALTDRVKSTDDEPMRLAAR
jgi:lysophospholipase L1-like esterase